MDYIEHIAVEGDTWDALALRYYYEEGEMLRLLQANPDLSDVLIFGGGEVVRVPVVAASEVSPESVTLPPWRA